MLKSITTSLPLAESPQMGCPDVFGTLTTQVREIYEMAVEAEPPYSLSDADCKTMCVRYAQLETRVRFCPWPAVPSCLWLASYVQRRFPHRCLS